MANTNTNTNTNTQPQAGSNGYTGPNVKAGNSHKVTVNVPGSGGAPQQSGSSGNSVQRGTSTNNYVEGGSAPVQEVPVNVDTPKRQEKDQAIADAERKKQAERVEPEAIKPDTLKYIQDDLDDPFMMDEELQSMMTEENVPARPNAEDTSLTTKPTTMLGTQGVNSLVESEPVIDDYDSGAVQELIGGFNDLASDDIGAPPAVPSGTRRRDDGTFVNETTGEVTESPVEATNAHVDEITASDPAVSRYANLPNGEQYDFRGKTPYQVERDMQDRGLSADPYLNMLHSYNRDLDQQHEAKMAQMRENTINPVNNGTPPSQNADQKNAAADPDDTEANSEMPPEEPPGSVTEDEEEDEGEYQDKAARRIQRIQQHVERVSEDFNVGFYDTTEDERDPKTGVVLERNEKAVKSGRMYLGIAGIADTNSANAQRIAWMQSQKFLGLSVDRHGKFAEPSSPDKEDAKEPENMELTPKDIMNTFEMMAENVKLYGSPYHTPHDQAILIHGTPCYTIPIPSMEEFELFSQPGGCWENMTYADVVQKGVDEWNNFIHPKLLATAKPGQIIAVEDMMRAAIMQTRGAIDYKDVHVLPVEAMHLAEIQDRRIRTAPDSKENDLLNEAFKAAEKKREEARMRTGQKWNGHKVKVKNADGSIDRIDWIEKGPENAMTGFVRLFLSGVRVAQTIDPMLMGANILEKAQGSAIYKGWREVEWRANNALAFRPTSRTINLARYSKQAMEALEAYTYLNDVAGYDYVLAFTNTGMAPTEENVQQFTREYLRLHPRKKGKKLHQLAERGVQFSAKVWGGDWVLRGSDMTNFIDLFMLNQVVRNRQEGTPMLFTPEELEQAFELDPAEAIKTIMSTTDGLRAYYTMRKRTLAGSTVFTEAIKEFFRRHPALDFLFVTSTGQKFLNFNLKAIRQWLPMMNTFELFAMQVKAGRINGNLDDVRFSELLTSESYKEALLLDLSYMTSNLAKVLMWMLLIWAHGLQPPDDERKMGMWDEYRIGRSIENSVPIRLPWYFDDATTWTLPVAMAVFGSVIGYGGKKLTHDQARDLIVDGCSDMTFGMITGAAQGLLENFDVDLINAQKINDNPEAELIDRTDNITQRIDIVLADTFADLISPRWINDFINYGIIPSKDNIARSSTMRYTTKTSDDPLATEPMDAHTAQMQKVAHDHPLFGLLWNMMDVINGTAFKEGEQWTGHLRSQMPARTLTDPIALTWVNDFDIHAKLDPETGRWVSADSEDDIETKCNYLIGLIEQFPNIDQLKAIDLCIPYDMRQYAGDYLDAKCNALDRKYYDALATPGSFSNGAGWVDSDTYWSNRNAFYDEIQAEKRKWKKIKQIIWSHDIPYSPYKSVSIATDYQQIFRDSEGNIITQPDALMRQLFGEEITKEYENYGNYKTALPFPWITGNRQRVIDEDGNQLPGRTYDDQSPVEWFDSGITMDQLRDIFQDKFVPKGTFEGRNCFDLLTADGQILTAVEGINSDVPLLGDRGYIPYDDVYPFDDSAKSTTTSDNMFTGSLGEEGKPLTDEEKNGSSGTSGYANYGGGYGSASYPSRKYYSRSSYGSYYRSGGSSYNPKIYSNSRSVSSDRASTMGAQRPYNKTGRTYLNPNFETKGSREAYKRGDF